MLTILLDKNLLTTQYVYTLLSACYTLAGEVEDEMVGYIWLLLEAFDAVRAVFDAVDEQLDLPAACREHAGRHVEVGTHSLQVSCCGWLDKLVAGVEDEVQG